MEQKQSDRLPPLSANYPWLVAQNHLEDDQIFHTVHDPLSRYRCRIPELLGRRIRACSYGWVILSNNNIPNKCYIWNPLTSKLIHLPCLDGDSEDILNCCLSSPPDEPGSILLLTRNSKPNLVFCRLDRKRKKWTEMSYSKQLTSITTNQQHDFLVQLTCFNGKVYALTDDYSCVIHVDIVVNGKQQVLISMSLFVMLPCPIIIGCGHLIPFLKGSSSGLYTIMVCLSDFTVKKPVDVLLYKLDMTSMVWVEMKDLKGTEFFVDMAFDQSVTCSPAIAIASSSELGGGGGYIHILHETAQVIYSYNIKDKTISPSSLDLPPRSRRRSHISVWAMPPRLQVDNGEETKCKAAAAADCKQDKGKGDETNYEIELLSSCKTKNELLNIIPFHVLEMIMEFCVGVEYLNFRATCKHCRSAAPVIQWSNATKRLQTYSLGSPWLMTFEKDGGIITFTDPMFGDTYFIKASQEMFFEDRILCCRYGWLLLFTGRYRMVFFNPFTSDIRELPLVPHAESFCFEEPPTSPDCIVFGFTRYRVPAVYIYYVDDPDPFWFRFDLDFGCADPFFVGFPTFYGSDIYALSNEGGLQVFRDDNFTLRPVIDEAPPISSCCTSGGSTEYFLVACDQHLLLVIVGEFGEHVEVFKLKDSTQEWEKMDGLGRHMVYICDRTCLCMDAKTPEMENKIYFPRLHSDNGKIVFYSLETRRYHTFNGARNVEESFEDFFVTKQHTRTHAWIEPHWS